MLSDRRRKRVLTGAEDVVKLVTHKIATLGAGSLELLVRRRRHIVLAH